MICVSLLDQRRAVPRLHWIWCYLIISQQRKEVCITWDVCDEASNVITKLSQYLPTVDDDDLTILEKFVVMMYDRSRYCPGCWLCEAGYVCSKTETIWSHSSNSSSSTSACEARYFPGRLYMEPVISMPARNTESCPLGMDQNRSSVADSLDHASSNCRELPAALQVWMQDRMLWTMQMPSFWSNSVCSCKCETEVQEDSLMHSNLMSITNTVQW